MTVQRRLRSDVAVFLIGVATAVAPLAPVDGKDDKVIMGWVEKVRLYPGDLFVNAKLDTGATSSSLDCDCIAPFERHGKKWIRIELVDATGKTFRFERQVLRTTKIKRHFGERQERFVIELGICLGDIFKEVEVNLANRSGFKYPMLIGRNFMAGSVIVDPAAKFTHEPACGNLP